MSEVFTVFYSWQSDRPRRHNQGLVRDALDLAADSISKDAEIPFKVSVHSDTENEPGLCNIPATILKRIREADAIVSDLTFIASTESGTQKHCSNPNVLFELGYAFSLVGPERLICVMNEKHGPAANQIFDLAHHRRPIAFTSPNDGTRAKTVVNLAKKLEAALRGVVSLGLSGGQGGDDEIMHQRQLSELETYAQQRRQRYRPKVQKEWGSGFEKPTFKFWFRPKLFRKKRFADTGSIEEVIRSKGVHIDRFERYPPSVKGNAPMDWGLYNDIYGDPWAITYSAQFWAEISIGGVRPWNLSERDAQVSPEPPTVTKLEPYHWIPIDSLTTISSPFQFARNLCTTFAESEMVEWEIEVSSLNGKWLSINQFDCVGPCRAPRIRRQGESSAKEFLDSYLDHFADFGKDLVDLFCRDGRTIDLNEIKSYGE